MFNALAVAAAIWAGAVIGCARYLIEGESVWAVALIALTPGAIVGIAAMLKFER